MDGWMHKCLGGVFRFLSFFLFFDPGLAGHEISDLGLPAIEKVFIWGNEKLAIRLQI